MKITFTLQEKFNMPQMDQSIKLLLTNKDSS